MLYVLCKYWKYFPKLKKSEKDGSKYNIRYDAFPRSGNMTKNNDELCHLTRSVSKIGRKMRNAVSSQEGPSAYPAPYARYSV